MTSVEDEMTCENEDEMTCNGEDETACEDEEEITCDGEDETACEEEDETACKADSSELTELGSDGTSRNWTESSDKTALTSETKESTPISASCLRRMASTSASPSFTSQQAEAERELAPPSKDAEEEKEDTLSNIETFKVEFIDETSFELVLSFSSFTEPVILQSFPIKESALLGATSAASLAGRLALSSRPE